MKTVDGYLNKYLRNVLPNDSEINNQTMSVFISKFSVEKLPLLGALASKFCVVCGNCEIQIKSLHYRIQHESIPLSEEKQLLRDIKQLEGTREKVIANDAMRVKIQDSLGEKDVIQGQVKVR